MDQCHVLYRDTVPQCPCLQSAQVLSMHHRTPKPLHFGISTVRLASFVFREGGIEWSIGGKHYRNWGPHWQMAQLFGYLGLFGEMLQMLFCGRDPEAREARLSSPWVFTLCTLTQPPPFTAPHRAHHTKLKTSPPSALVVWPYYLSLPFACGLCPISCLSSIPGLFL